MEPLMKVQTYANHRRTVFGFHIAMGLVVLVNLVYQVVQGVKAYSTPQLFNILVAVALMQGFWYMRQFPKVVQDRLIRLEETLRLQRLAPDLQKRGGEFTPAQLVGLRFASDKELPGLAKKVLDEKIESREAIKKLITDWRADHFRV